MAVVDGSKVLIGETQKGRLYVYLDEYRSHRYLHIRYWYHCKKDDQWKPGTTGIAIPESMIGKVLEGVALVLKLLSGGKEDD